MQSLTFLLTGPCFLSPRHITYSSARFGFAVPAHVVPPGVFPRYRFSQSLIRTGFEVLSVFPYDVRIGNHINSDLTKTKRWRRICRLDVLKCR